MATSFPSGLDDFTNPSGSDALDSVTVPHASQHTNLNDAVEALEAKVGVDGSAVVSSLDYKVAQLAPKDASFVTLGTDSTLTNERVLTAGSGISVSDGGAGSTVTVASFTPGGAARPLLTAGAYLDGSNGLVLSGLASNYASTPDSAALSITGDIDIKAKVTLTDWTPAATTSVVGKWQSNSTRSFRLAVLTDGKVQLIWSDNGIGSTGTASTVATGFADGTTNWIRATLDVDNGASGRTLKFYTSSDGTSWGQLGTSITTPTTTNIFDSTSQLEVGSTLAGTGDLLTGTIHRVLIQSAYDTANNTDNLVFDADFSAQTADALAFTESSSNAATVTINTTRYTYGIPGSGFLSIGTLLLGANVDYFDPFMITSSTVVDLLAFEVTTAPSSTSTIHAAIYAADANFQPTGAPIASFGPITAATSTTGVYTSQITPVTLAPGTYVLGFNLSAQLIARTYRRSDGLINTLGGNPILGLTTGIRTNASFPNPSAGWNGRGSGSVGRSTFAVLRWRAA